MISAAWLMGGAFSDGGSMSVKADGRNIRFNGWPVNPSPQEEAGGQAHAARSPGRLQGPKATRVPMAPRDHIPNEFQELLTRLVGRRVK
jgi:hypothetical protein